MKLQATITIFFQAGSLADAGGKLDDVLTRARQRDDVDVGSVELHTPVGAGPVTLPQVGTGSTQPAADWVRTNLPDLGASPPQVSSGEVVIQF